MLKVQLSKKKTKMKVTLPNGEHFLIKKGPHDWDMKTLQAKIQICKQLGKATKLYFWIVTDTCLGFVLIIVVWVGS